MSDILIGAALMAPTTIWLLVKLILHERRGQIIAEIANLIWWFVVVWSPILGLLIITGSTAWQAP